MSFPKGVVPTSERVHPTPLYEFLAWMLIAWLLWRIGAATIRAGKPGRVFCAYLLLTGVARYLVETIRLNPRSFWGLSNAQAASVVSVLAGFALLVVLQARSRYPAARESRAK